MTLQKARLIELNPDLKDEKSGGKNISVQFNPETLKVAFSNQIKQPANSAGGGARNSSTPARDQFVGAGTTKLTLQLWFDVSGPLPVDDNGQPVQDQKSVTNVRDLTKNVVYFMTPAGTDQDHLLPPSVEFRWGTFSFKGLFDSLDETLEFFSEDGVPLRASMNISMTQQSINGMTASKDNKPPPGAGGGKTGSNPSGPGGPGTSPMAQAPAGKSLQALAASTGRGGNWQAIAEANGIENPRQLLPGQIINMNIKTGS